MTSEYGSYGADRHASYPTPADALIVSTTGSDTTGVGTLAAPYRTVKHALTKVGSGGTVAIRGGSYHEGANYPNATAGAVFVHRETPGVTIQNYAGEEVWFDGSVPVTGWAPYDTNKWRAPFVYSAFRDSTSNRGEDPATNFYGSWLLDEFPRAAWPEMVLIDGVKQTQVGALSDVGPGRFFVQGSYPGTTDATRNRFDSTHYVLGADPTGKEVRIGNIQRALTSAAADCTIRGVGFRRYVPSVPDISAVYQNDEPGSFIENVTVQDISDCGLDVESADWTIRKSTFLDNGREAIAVGIHADNGMLEWCYFEGTNWKRFNYGPISGDIKLAAQWDTEIRFNRMHNTMTHSIWFDVCAYRAKIYGNYMTNVWGRGILYEISARGWIVGNVIVNNGVYSTDNNERRPYDGVAISTIGSKNTNVWHNTLINCEVPVRWSEGYRKPLNADGRSWATTHPLGPVHAQDKTRGDAFYQARGYVDTWDFYQREMTWTSDGAVMANNVFAGTSNLNSVQSCFLAFGDEVGENNTVDLVGQLSLPNIYCRPDGVNPKRFSNAITYGTSPNTPSLTSVYWDLTSPAHDGSTPWRTLMADTQSVLVAADVVKDKQQHLLEWDTGILATAPVAPAPAEVQAMLAASPFTTERVGAGDPIVTASVPDPVPVPVAGQPFRDIRVGTRPVIALLRHGKRVWPPA